MPESDDLMLSLLQVADSAPEPAPIAPSTGPLGSLKPYAVHKECGGAVLLSIGVATSEETDDDVPACMYMCAKCQKQQLVLANPVALSFEELSAGKVFPVPDWVLESPIGKHD